MYIHTCVESHPRQLKCTALDDYIYMLCPESLHLLKMLLEDAHARTCTRCIYVYMYLHSSSFFYHGSDATKSREFHNAILMD